jgi:hypothetical protein
MFKPRVRRLGVGGLGGHRNAPETGKAGPGQARHIHLFADVAQALHEPQREMMYLRYLIWVKSSRAEIR